MKNLVEVKDATGTVLFSINTQEGTRSVLYRNGFRRTARNKGTHLFVNGVKKGNVRHFVSAS